MPNALIHETSPYLLQHAHNPVDWHAWGEIAIAKAKAENKPILLSIGYAACHWCHVMEHESFEDAAVAALMNKYFINIKVDREERPDIDHIYMDALQAMTGQGGWPLNMFITPDLEPFYGGTYFPPAKAYGRESWMEVLEAVHRTWTQKGNELIARATEMRAHLEKSNRFGDSKNTASNFTIENLLLCRNNIIKNADTIHGGFGAAPKFPQFHSINFLLRQAHFLDDTQALQQAIVSIKKMCAGGIYDQLGGGLSRYSTDTYWLVPHFEKMLYDNALFLQSLSEAYTLTQQKEFLKTIEETINFAERDLLQVSGLYAAAMDADSEGIEGKYYCWTKNEIESVLPPQQAGIFCEFYSVTEQGNWTEPHHEISTNILHQTITVKALATTYALEEAELVQLLEDAKSKLLQERYKRVPPLTDDKCILGWNALFNKALVMAGNATRNKAYLTMAEKQMEAMIQQFFVTAPNGTIQEVFHTFKNGKATINAFLDDLAYTLDAFLAFYNATLDDTYISRIKNLTDYVYARFSDPDSPFFFFTPENQEYIIVRKKEIYDGATPSGNSIMAGVLIDAAILCQEPKWRERGEQMLFQMSNGLLKHTNSFAIWASLVQKQVFLLNEISFSLPSDIEKLNKINSLYIPFKIYIKNDQLAAPKWMLCRDKNCLSPVADPIELILQIKNGENLILAGNNFF